ncbi:universal stress protein [Sporomusa sp. KB1]|uniref:universal stress protein n=1 Tax=Sporomusa sp. KB1 TaxID=943346 RepID=UPI0011ABE77F|nr:universal stress protein [Sporomusa sp. KB1]TWH45076.1 nucleotide-binding universal stress UspA family protein [Sporomusa sp. KB1]
MEKFRSMLVPFDGSEHSQRALKCAIYLAELCQAKIELLCVVDLTSEVSAFEQVRIGGYISDDSKAAERTILNEAQSQVSHTLQPENILEIEEFTDLLANFHIKNGEPTEVIVNFCRENNYDLIIMGSKGRGGIKQLLGSVSSYVLCHAPCPVVVVR